MGRFKLDRTEKWCFASGVFAAIALVIFLLAILVGPSAFLGGALAITSLLSWACLVVAIKGNGKALEE